MYVYVRIRLKKTEYYICIYIYTHIYIYIYILALTCAFKCTDSNGSGGKVDQGAQYIGAACCYHNFPHNLYHNSYPFHRERERETKSK